MTLSDQVRMARTCTFLLLRPSTVPWPSGCAVVVSCNLYLFKQDVGFLCLAAMADTPAEGRSYLASCVQHHILPQCTDVPLFMKTMRATSQKKSAFEITRKNKREECLQQRCCTEATAQKTVRHPPANTSLIKAVNSAVPLLLTPQMVGGPFLLKHQVVQSEATNHTLSTYSERA